MEAEGSPRIIENSEKRKEDAFYRTLRSLPEEAQDYVKDLSSQMMEIDEFSQHKTDKASLDSICNDLTSLGVNKRQVSRIMRRFFGSTPKST